MSSTVEQILSMILLNPKGPSKVEVSPNLQVRKLRLGVWSTLMRFPSVRYSFQVYVSVVEIFDSETKQWWQSNDAGPAVERLEH